MKIFFNIRLFYLVVFLSASTLSADDQYNIAVVYEFNPGSLVAPAFNPTWRDRVRELSDVSLVSAGKASCLGLAYYLNEYESLRFPCGTAFLGLQFLEFYKLMNSAEGSLREKWGQGSLLVTMASVGLICVSFQS